MILLLFFNSLSVWGQKKFHIERYGTENGLPSNGIKGIQWDEKTGFLWIATEAGIVRYNGLDFKIFSARDEPTLLQQRIVFLAKNNNGTIIFGSINGNVYFRNSTAERSI